MISIKTIVEAEQVLAGYVPLTRNITGGDITVERMIPLMQALGNPQDKLKIVHVAGTSGKTSTAYYITELLRLSGCRVGLTVSPHVDSVTERVQVNNSPISETDFASALTNVLRIIEEKKLEPTYFELLVGLAYWYFALKEVDYAVIETGLGGLHDGTNIATSRDKLCVITDIGLDHMAILGDTIQQIAKQKAGIIQHANTAIMHKQSEEVMEVFENWCKDQHANLYVASDFKGESLETMPAFQQRNWTLACQAYLWLKERDGLEQLMPMQLLESMKVRIPGRMDIRKIGDKMFIMDGAHNEQKMQAFVQSFKKQYPDKKVPILISLKRGKDFTAVLPLIKPITSKLFITEFDEGQDLPVPAIDAIELGAAAKKFGFSEVITEQNREKAFELFIGEDEKLLIITGSFYLIGQLRQTHKELQHD